MGDVVHVLQPRFVVSGRTRDQDWDGRTSGFVHPGVPGAVGEVSREGLHVACGLLGMGARLCCRYGAEVCGFSAFVDEVVPTKQLIGLCWGAWMGYFVGWRGGRSPESQRGEE